MYSSIALMAGFALGALAKDSTSVQSIFLGGPTAAGQAWAGSVVNVDSSATTYEIVCTSGCSSASQATESVTVGPSNFNFDYATTTLGQEASVSESCKVTGTTEAACEITVSINVGVEGATTIATSVVTTTTFSGDNAAWVPVTLTGGVEKLAAATSDSSASGTSGSSSSKSASGSASSASTSGSASSASTSGAASSASSSGSGAASIRANGRAGDVLAMVMVSAVSVSVGALMML